METYPYSLDSERQPGVPQGAITRHLWQSKIYEGSYREYFVYVPAQYDGSRPAALMVFQDGKSYLREDGDFRVPIVFDNLIHKNEMPLTIGLFINPGHHKSKLPAIPYQCSNRSWEYDELSDRYARFLIEEMIPELQKNYMLADDPKMRAVCGLSSGAICAFTVAWERPDYFHKVLSHIGSYTDIRGGHVYPTLIRKSAKRDIKVFLQDGANDLDNRFGNWWLANQQLAAALAFRHYDYHFAGGTGGHDGKHGGAILPDSLRWLWAK